MWCCEIFTCKPEPGSMPNDMRLLIEIDPLSKSTPNPNACFLNPGNLWSYHPMEKLGAASKESPDECLPDTRIT